MKDENKFIELNAEEAEKVVGGYDDEDGNWVPPTCSILQRWYSMPDMFQKSGDYTEQLLPDNICEKDGIIDRLVSYFPENDWKNNVQMIGWMYQYFSTELREEIIEGLKKNIKVSKKKIAVANQIFTPDWIVRYIVENSL